MKTVQSYALSALVLAAVVSTSAHGAITHRTFRASWNAVNSPNVQEYCLYHGTTAGSYPDKQCVGKVTNFEWTLPVTGGTDRFAAKTVGTDGSESEFSQEVVVQSVDSDDDGIPDDYETDNGLNPSNSSDATADQDSDGFFALQEFQAGTNPFDAGSVPENSTLAAAMLPSSRSVELGDVATAFVTVINTATTRANDCSIAPIGQGYGDFFFQTTNPATNEPTGVRNRAVDIGAGAFQTFIIGFTPTQAFAPTEVMFNMDCADALPAPIVVGVNTLMFTASNTPVPDVIAVALTTTLNGVSNVQNGIGAFVVATTNIGEFGSIQAVANTGDADLPLSVSMCQTDPDTSACANPTVPTTGPVTVSMATDSTATFGIFVSSGSDIGFDPASNRVFVRFEEQGTRRGSTSVAVRTQ